MIDAMQSFPDDRSMTAPRSPGGLRFSVVNALAEEWLALMEGQGCRDLSFMVMFSAQTLAEASCGAKVTP
jgi:hypothetical protein